MVSSTKQMYISMKVMQITTPMHARIVTHHPKNASSGLSHFLPSIVPMGLHSGQTKVSDLNRVIVVQENVLGE